MTKGDKLHPPRAPPTPSPTPGLERQGTSKLPKFLQKSTITRDRSRSVIDPMMMNSASPVGVDNGAGSSSSSSMSMFMTTSAGEPPINNVNNNNNNNNAGTSSQQHQHHRHRGDRKFSAKLKGTLRELKDDRIGQIAHGRHANARDVLDEEDGSTIGIGTDGDMPVIVEPASPASTRSRTRSERLLSASSSDSHPNVNYYPSSSAQRMPEMSMGSRLSGWFSHTFSSSSTDLSLPTILANTAPAVGSSKSKSGGGFGILTAARHGKGHLDKAMRYLLDSDATPDKCIEPIWLLGVQHPGCEVPPPPPPSSSPPSSGRRSSLDIRRSSSVRNSLSSMRGATSSPEPSTVHPHGGKNNAAAGWPPGFYADFTSRVWLTYRTHYPPIRDQTLVQLEAEASGQVPPQLVSASPRRWNILGGGEKGWTSDSGWGCMLRTGQSLLANALIHLHLGRDWRRPPHPVYTADYATYVKILTWFFDSSDVHCPFSVHRMALAGKDLGKDVGQWFGPSTAAGAIKTLVNAFAEAGLGVSVATDGVVYETDVLAASNAGPYMYRHSRVGTSSPNANRRRRSAQQQAQQQQQSMLSPWGQRPVLVLVGIRLGIDGVNPVYYDAVKALFTFPQSVGIAGGRPSSSYYFVGVQADNLFYLDPHHARPTVPFRPPPSNLETQHQHQAQAQTFSRSPTAANNNYNNYNYGFSSSPPTDSPPSSYREPFQVPGGTSGGNANANTGRNRHVKASSSISSYASQTMRLSPSNSQGSAASAGGASLSGVSMYGGLDPTQEHYVTAYSPMELRTFHCERVRKMHLSGLDPSMLIGFLCRDERDWKDLRERVSEMSKKYKTIFAIQDEPPSWPSDSDEMGMESVSDVDIDMDEPDEPATGDLISLSPEPEGDDGLEDPFGQREKSQDRGRRSEEVTTEEDAIDPITPGPSTVGQTFQEQQQQVSKLADDVKGMNRGDRDPLTTEKDNDDRGEDDRERDVEEDLLGDDEEWVDTDTNSPLAPSSDPSSSGRPQPRQRQRTETQKPRPNLGLFPIVPMSKVDSTATTASYVSAESSYSNLHDSPVESRKGSPQALNAASPSEKEFPEREKEEKKVKPRRSTKMRSSKSAAGKVQREREASTSSQAQAQAQEYVPFPVVDDREPDDYDDLQELSCTSQSSGLSGGQGQGRSGALPGFSGRRSRRRSGSVGSVKSESANRTPLASVASQPADSNLASNGGNSSHANGRAGIANGNENGNGFAGYTSENPSGPVNGTGYRIRNVFARDGGRTQSGGVRGIIAADLDEVSDA